MTATLALALAVLPTASAVPPGKGSVSLAEGAASLPATASAGGAASVAAPALAPAADAPTGTASEVPQPTLTQVPLAGVDESLRSPEPEPDDHDHGTLGALSAEPELRLALAAKVPIAEPAALVAVTATKDFEPGTTIQVRVKEEEHGWSAWTSLGVDPEHGPDPASAEGRAARPGSEPLLAVGAVRAHVRIDTPSGTLPKGTRLAIVKAPTAASDRAIAAQPVSSDPSSAPDGSMSAQSLSGSSLAASSTVGKPSIVTRSQWGADESWRSRAPYYTNNIRAGFIHHTASTSNYTAAQAAAQIRAIYRYHTKSLGHSDIDYNFLVDRFGRLYEGRYGGMDRPVLGGHTAGFNEHTFAAVALGNFESSTVPSAQMAAIKDSLARLFAWKLGLSGVSPASTVKLVSAGFSRPTRYPKGSVATLTATSTHRTVNYTSCPGKYLQAQIPSIIALGAKYSNVVVSAPTSSADGFPVGSRSKVSLTSSSTRAVSWRADVLSPCSDTPVRSYSGRTSGAGQLKFSWDLRDTDGKRVLPATYTVRISGTDSSGSRIAVVTSTVTITPEPGGDWGPCANASRVAADTVTGTSVLWGRISAPSSRRVVLTGNAGQSGTALAAGVAAAPLAKSLKAPLLTTPAEKLSSAVAADLRSRGATEVLIVGGSKVISADVEAAVAALGARVTRLSGGSAVRTAAVVAERMGSASSAVLVSTQGSPAHSLAGAALAAARGVPVLIGTSGALAPETASALADRSSVVVAAPSRVFSDATLRAGLSRSTTWQRLTGTDAVAASLAVARDFPSKTTAAMVLPESPESWATAPIAAAAGSPLLFTTSPVLAPDIADHLRSRKAMRATTTTVTSTWLDDQVLGAASRVLLGIPWAPPGVPIPTEVPDPAPAESPTPTGKVRLERTNAKPEPVAKGATLKVRAKVQAKYTDGTWRKVPKGVGFKVQHRPTGKKYRAVATGYTTKGWAKAEVRAKTSGRWRIKIGEKKGRRDYVRVAR